MLAIPNICARGTVVSIKFRHIDHDDHERKYDQPAGQTLRLFNTRALLSEVDTIVVTEGEMDCYDEDTEVFTESGWVRFGDYDGTSPVLEYRDGGELVLVEPSAFIVDHDRERIRLRTARRGGVDLVVTPGHRMVSTLPDGTGLHTHRADSPTSARHVVPRVGVLDGPGVDMSDDEIRLVLAISADASIDLRKRDGAQYARFGFKRERKIARLTALLNRLGVDHSSEEIANGYTSICFRVPNYLHATKILPTAWLSRMSVAQRELVLAEMVEWDGNRVVGKTQDEYNTNILANAEWMQFVAHTTGRVSTIITRSNEHGYWWKVSVLHKKRSTSWQSIDTHEHSRGDVYCVSVPSGMLLVRRNREIVVSGNCITLTQLGIPAVSVPSGANSWNGKRHWRLLEGYRRVVLFRDNDEAGGELVKKVLESDLPVHVVAPPGGFKDVNEAHQNGYDEQIIALVNGDAE